MKSSNRFMDLLADLAIASIAIYVVTELKIDMRLMPNSVYIMYVVPVVLAAYWRDRLVAYYTLGLSTAAILYFLLPRAANLGLTLMNDIPQALFFVAVSTLVVELVTRLRQSDYRNQELSTSLQHTGKIVDILKERLSEDGSTYDILDSLPDPTMILKHDWELIYANPMARKLQGYSGDIIGQNFWEFFPRAKDTSIHDFYVNAMKSNAPMRTELFFEPEDRWYEIQTFPHRAGMLVHLNDISSQKRASDKYDDVVRLLDQALDSSPSRQDVRDYRNTAHTHKKGQAGKT